MGTNIIEASAIKQIRTGDNTTRDVICNPRIVRIVYIWYQKNKKKEKKKKKKEKLKNIQKTENRNKNHFILVADWAYINKWIIPWSAEGL